MIEKMHYCRSSKEFRLEGLFSALVLEPAEEEYLSSIKHFIEETEERWSQEKKEESFFLMWVRSGCAMFDSLEKRCRDVFDEYHKSNKHYTTSIEISLYQKIYRTLVDTGFIRKDFKLDNRIAELFCVAKYGCYGDDILKWDFFAEFDSKLYETYEPNADSRVIAAMDYLKDKLPPLQYDIFKFHIEHGVQNKYEVISSIEYNRLMENREYYENLSSSHYYSEFEAKLLIQAAQNVKRYYDDIIKIIIF